MPKMLGMSSDGMSDQSIRADVRPMSLAISNAKNVVIKNFSVIQPQFWASIIIESENVLVQDFYVNATSYNPSVSDLKNLGV
jgi:galacturan 1,4-alpha-galacturonidase